MLQHKQIGNSSPKILAHAKKVAEKTEKKIATNNASEIN